MTVIITQGDCLSSAGGMSTIADKSVDHAIFDPPYSDRVHRRLGAEVRSDGGKSRSTLTFGCVTEDLARRVSHEVCRITKRWIVVFCDELSFGLWVNAIESSGGEYVRKGTWWKTDAMPQMSGDRPATGTEEMVIAHAPRTSGRMRWNGGGKAARYRGLAQEPGVNREHQAQKPLWLMKAIVSDFTDRGDIVVDPFAGSGSTGVACKMIGRSFLGWELDATFAEIARRRIEQAREQMSLFGDQTREAQTEAGPIVKGT